MGAIAPPRRHGSNDHLERQPWPERPVGLSLAECSATGE
jgi:hypothetical protein